MAKEYSIKKFFLKYILAILIVAISTLLIVQYYFSYKMVLELTQKRFYHLAKQVSIVIQEREKQAKDIVSLLGNTSLINSVSSLEQEKELLKLFITPIKKSNKIYAIYIGYQNGNYFEVVNVKHSQAVAKMFNAPSGARWVVVQIVRLKGVGYRVSHFYDEKLNYISKLEETTQYDPRNRPWFKIALNKDEVVATAPYMYYRLRKMGITYSLSINDKMVVALDITLEGLSKFLKELKFSTHTEIYMIEGGKLIASSEGIQKEIDKEILDINSSSKNIVSYTKNGEEYLSMIIPISKSNPSSTLLAFKAPKASMMKSYIDIIYIEVLITTLLILLLIPLVKNLSKRFIRPIDMLMRENESVKRREFDKISPIKSEILELNQLSNSLVDMAKSIKDYEQKQEELLEGFIHLIADTIDVKSPYTGEHCKRVPIIAQMLIREADRADSGSLRDFKIKDKDILKGLKWSAWLHDCGKLVVPEHIIDKSTKLETVYNRIHEVRTRFEVLLRDEKIKYLESLLIGDDQERAKETLEKNIKKLQDDFEFIGKINLGGEEMSDEDCKRLHQISQIEWERNFSNRIGISWVERELLGDTTQDEKLPAKERLLSDNTSLEIPRNQQDLLLFKKEQVTMKIPKLLYNKGELYNLCIKRGTLTEEERFKINEHAIHTIRMLKELPWSDKLRSIVEDAGNHHEHLDGTGYPRSLKAKDLSIPARVMAIADIFEALTASNRPYKEPKTLSQTLKIMSKMAKNNKIDYELFTLFVKRKIYLKFANLYLKPKQIDVENIKEDELI